MQNLFKQVDMRQKNGIIQTGGIFMGKYEQDCRQLLTLVGGKENIAAVSHCVTRMRFVLN